MLYHIFNQGSNTKDKLPIKIQVHLWKQLWDVLRSEDEKLKKSVCIHLERLIHQNRAKELQSTDSEVFSAIKSIPRWIFLSGSVPYVIHCTAAILDGLAPKTKPSGPFLKLLSTLHWLLLESFTECPDANTGLDLPTIELFIQNLIPNMPKLSETDVTTNLLWQPLWNHLPPSKSLLALPVVSGKVKTKSLNQSSDSLSSNSQASDMVTIATYFDVAVMKVMMVENWTQYGYRWGLQYLQYYLQSILLRQGFDVDNCPVLEVINKFTTVKSVSPTSILSFSSFGTTPDDDGTPKSFWQQDNVKIQVSDEVPDALLSFVNPDGTLKLSFFLNLVKKLVKNKAIVQLSGSLLLVLEQLVEVALDDQHLLKTLIKHYPSLLYCQIKIMKMFGCEQNCGVGIRCVKGDHLRYLAHDYLKRLLKADRQRAKVWFQKYAENEELSELLQLLHSLFGFCEWQATHTSNLEETQSKKWYTRVSFNTDRYIEHKNSNETLIIDWISPYVYQKLARVWKAEESLANHDFFTSVVQLTKFVQGKYINVFRRLVLSGILNSFTKTSPKEGKGEMSFDFYDSINTDGSNSSPVSLKSTNGGKTSFESNKNGSKHPFRKKIMTMMHSQKEMESDASVGSPPKFFTLPRGTSIDKPSCNLSTSLPQDLHSSFHDQDLESTSTSLNESRAQTLEKQTRGKTTNLYTLYHGLKQFRCLLNLAAPGGVPDETVVAAMLDLEGPVLSRAAYLVELAYFVHQCNKDDWPALLMFLKHNLLKGYSSHSNSVLLLKYQAGVLFHKWGVAVGRKLEELLNDEEAQEFPINLLYQGEKDTVSSYCPHSLRFAACQLLMEITSYLRETHATLVSNSILTSSDSPLLGPHHELREAASSNERRQKQTIAAALSKRLFDLKRRKSSVHLLAGVTASNPEGLKELSSPSRSPVRAHRMKSAGQGLKTTRSPKSTRKFSRQTSRTPLSNEPQSNYAALNVDDYEAMEFPWLDVLILMNQSINFLCPHDKVNCLESCPLQQMKSCNELMRALKQVYEFAMLEMDDASTSDLAKIFKAKNEKMDPVYKYLCEQVGSFYHVPFSVLCKGVFVMENQQLTDTISASWEVLLYPDEKLKAAAACLFLIAGWRLEASVSNFLIGELTCQQADDRAKNVRRFGVLWDCQNTVYNHLEYSTKNALKVPMPRLDYTLPSRMIGENPDNLLVPDAPWDPEDQMMNDFDLSDDEVSVYFYDSEKQKKLKTRKRTKKLKQLKEEYTFLSTPLAFIDSWMQEEDESGIPQSTVPIIQEFFPPVMSHGILHLIRLLDDTSVAACNSQAVSDVAYQMVWKGLVDNPTTFFRRFFEKITKINKQDELILLLRKLLFHMPKLPGHAAYTLFNNLVGIVSYYDRTRRQGYQERIAEITSLLSQIVPSVPKIYFADMKQSLRREHVDNVLMVTANVGCVKNVIVHYTGKPKENLDVMDEMTFKELLTQLKKIFGVESDDLWLVDKHSGLILENSSKIRDVYVFKRGFPCPVLKLEKLEQEAVTIKRQQQVKTGKLSSISQLMLTMSTFDVLPNKKHVMFLYSELYHQASFPRRAIDIEFDLCQHPELGKEIVGLDAIFKDHWIRFISKLLMHLSELHTFDEEMIGLFLDPINGAILLHCEDVMVLRTSIAALINVAKSYGKKFSNDGYYDILPTIFRVYSHHENNMLVKESMEFAISKFYRLHGSPFLLQMFASAAPILMTDDMSTIPPEEQSDLIPARCLFAILESLEREIPDKLDIMSLVQGEKPIRPYDNVLDQPEENQLDLSIRLALTIIAYRSESSRALQMMFVLSAIIPYYLKYLESATEAKPEELEPKKKEKRQIKNMIKYVATIIEQNDTLVHGYRTEGSITSDNLTDAASNSGMWGRITSALSAVRNWFSHAGELIQEGDELERTCIFDEDGENPLLIGDLQERKVLEDYYQPRTVLLTLASDFTMKCTERYTILHKDKDGKGRAETNFSDIVEEENTLILIDVAMSLLKLVFYDHSVLLNPGLQRFLLEAMPSISWSENLEAYTLIVKRMNRIFNKCLQKPDYVKFVDWDGLEILIRGIYLTLKKDSVVADVEDIRDLVHTCTRLMIGDFNNSPSYEVSAGENLKSPCALIFNTTLVKLTSKLLSLRPYQYNIQANFACYVQDVDHKKVERFLVYWLLPLCIRMGTGRYDMPSMESEDIYFVITVLMTLLSPDSSLTGSLSGVKGSLALMTSVTVGRQLTVTRSLSKICFLGFKILLTVFTDTFGKLWKSLKTALSDYMDTYEADYSLWLFVSHIVSNRSPILIHLLPIIRKKLVDVSKFPAPIERICQRIKKDLVKPPVINGRALVLQQLLNDLSALATTDAQQVDPMDETDEGGSGFDLESPPRTRQLEEDEDDARYIQRVKTEMRKSGRDPRTHRSSKNSIMKRRTTPKEHVHANVRKQVSFQHDDENAEIIAATATGSPSRSLSSPKKMRLSKRSKLRVFRRQTKEEKEEKEDIIQNDAVDESDNSCPHHDDQGELSDDSQGQLVHQESPTPCQQVRRTESKDSIRVHKILSEGASQRKMFFTGSIKDRVDEDEEENGASDFSNETGLTVASNDGLSDATNDNNGLPVASKVGFNGTTNGNNELAAASNRSFDHESFSSRVAKSVSLPLSRSPGVRRRNDGASLKISGMSFDDEPKRGISRELGKRRLATTESLTKVLQGEPHAAIENVEDVNKRTSNVESSGESFGEVSDTSLERTLSSSQEKINVHRTSLSTQRKVFMFDHLLEQSTMTSSSANETTENSSTGLSLVTSFNEGVAIGSPATPTNINNTRSSSTEIVSPPLSPRSPRSPKLPKLPTFDESRMVDLQRKISEDH